MSTRKSAGAMAAMDWVLGWVLDVDGGVRKIFIPDFTKIMGDEFVSAWTALNEIIGVFALPVPSVLKLKRAITRGVCSAFGRIIGRGMGWREVLVTFDARYPLSGGYWDTVP